MLFRSVFLLQDTANTNPTNFNIAVIPQRKGVKAKAPQEDNANSQDTSSLQAADSTSRSVTEHSGEDEGTTSEPEQKRE